MRQLGKHWIGLVGAAVGSAALAVFQGLTGKTVPPLVYLVVIVGGVAIASFFAWREQYRAVERAKDEVRELTAKLEARSAPTTEIEFPTVTLKDSYQSEINFEANVKNVSDSSIDGLGIIIEKVQPSPIRSSILSRTSDAKFPWALRSSEQVHRLNPLETFPIPIGVARFSAPGYENGKKFCILRMAHSDGSLSDRYASFESGKDYTMDVRVTAHDYKGPLQKFIVRVERHQNEDIEWYILLVVKA